MITPQPTSQPLARPPGRCSLLAGLFLFCGGGLALGGAGLLHLTLGRVVPDAVRLELGLTDFTPTLDCRVTGTNPLPVAIRLLDYHLVVGARQLPVALEWTAPGPQVIPAGPFELRLPLFGPGANYHQREGAGLSPTLLQGLGYHGRLLVGVGPFRRQLAMQGLLQAPGPRRSP